MIFLSKMAKPIGFLAIDGLKIVLPLQSSVFRGLAISQVKQNLLFAGKNYDHQMHLNTVPTHVTLLYTDKYLCLVYRA